MQEIIKDLDDKCNKSVEAFKVDLKAMRTGRAAPGMLETIMVDYYGTQTPLKQLALISAPEPRLLTVQIYDVSAVDAVDKAILKSDLGFTPSRDGNLLRIVVPQLTKERREQLVKSLNKDSENYKAAIRGHRQKANDEVKKMEKDKGISEDDGRKLKEQVQKICDKFTDTITELFKKKEQELLDI